MNSCSSLKFEVRLDYMKCTTTALLFMSTLFVPLQLERVSPLNSVRSLVVCFPSVGASIAVEFSRELVICFPSIGASIAVEFGNGVTSFWYHQMMLVPKQLLKSGCCITL